MSTLLILIMFGCGEDPILKKAREMEEAKAATGAQPGTQPGGGLTPGKAGDPPPGKAGDPLPGKPGEPPPVAGMVIKPGIPEEPAPGKPGDPAPAGVSLTPGVPDEPTPGKPGDPAPAGVSLTPGVPDEPTPGRPDEPRPGNPGEGAEYAGPRVEVTGTVVFADWKRGEVRITAFDGDHQDPTAHPKIIGEVKISQPGYFVLKVPENAGRIYIEAAVDEDMDGRPGPQDPQGKADRSPVTVGSSSVSGLTVSLTRREPPPGAPKGDDF